jgi:hypothetical protein
LGRPSIETSTALSHQYFQHAALQASSSPSREHNVRFSAAVRREGHLFELGGRQLVLSPCIPEVRLESTDRSASSLLTVNRADRIAVLDAIKDAKLKTLRIFISQTLQNNKNTGSVAMPDIEPQTVGTWDDTQLRAIDQLMVEARERGTRKSYSLI